MKTSFTDMLDFIKIYNQDEFLTDNPKEACLSIITTPREVFELNPKWVLSKQVMFEDTDSIIHPRVFSHELAREVVEFLMEVHSSGVESLIMHCFAGVSRSRAVVMFFEEVLKENPIEDIQRTPFITANRLVYSRLVKAYWTIIDEQYDAERKDS